MSDEPVQSDDPRMLAWRAFLHAYSAVVARLEVELQAETQLTLSQYEVLLRLSFAPEGRMRMQDLAGSVLLSKSGITRLVDRMGVAGLVERAPCESDRRVTWAGITEEGRRVLRESAPVHLRGVEEHFTRFLGPEDAASLSSLMLRIFRHAAEDPASSDSLGEPARQPA